MVMRQLSMVMSFPIRTRLAAWASAGGLVASLSASGCVGTGAQVDRNDVAGLLPREFRAVALEGDEAALPPLTGALTADEAVRRAMATSPRVREIISRLGMSRAKLLEASQLPNLHLEAEVVSKARLDWDLRAEYAISEALWTIPQKSAASEALEAERMRVARELIVFGYEVRSSFARAQAAEARAQLEKQAAEAFDAARELSDALKQAGNVSTYAHLRYALPREEAAMRAAQAESAALEARSTLAALVGIDAAQLRIAKAAGPSAEPTPPSAATKAAGAEAIAAQSSPPVEDLELQALGKDDEALRRMDRHLGVRRVLPEVSVGAIATREGDLPTAPAADENEWHYGGFATLTLPIFDPHAGARARVDAERRRTSARQESTRRESRGRQESVARTLHLAEADATRIETTLLPAAKDLLREALLHYNAMQIGAFELLDAKRELLRIERLRIDALERLHISRAAHAAMLAGAIPVMPLSAAKGADSGDATDSSSKGGH